MLMYSQSTLGSTQPGERPVTLATHRRHGNTPSCGMPLLKREAAYAPCDHLLTVQGGPKKRGHRFMTIILSNLD